MLFKIYWIFLSEHNAKDTRCLKSPEVTAVTSSLPFTTLIHCSLRKNLFKCSSVFSWDTFVSATLQSSARNSWFQLTVAALFWPPPPLRLSRHIIALTRVAVLRRLPRPNALTLAAVFESRLKPNPFALSSLLSFSLPLFSLKALWPVNLPALFGDCRKVRKHTRARRWARAQHTQLSLSIGWVSLQGLWSLGAAIWSCRRLCSPSSLLSSPTRLLHRILFDLPRLPLTVFTNRDDPLSLAHLFSFSHARTSPPLFTFKYLILKPYFRFEGLISSYLIILCAFKLLPNHFVQDLFHHLNSLIAKVIIPKLTIVHVPN